MKLYLTKGMFGDKLETIGAETENAKNIIEHIFGWKNDDANKKKYKIESYDRLIFGKNKIAIDFGDYMYFLLVDGVSDDQKTQFTEI